MILDDKQKKRERMIKKLKDWQIDQSKAYRSYIKTSAVGLEFGLSIAMGALLGYFVDKYFLSSPYGLLIGIIVGSIAAVRCLWVFVKSYLAKNDHNNDK
jgi:ATP synthase protein I